MGTDLLSSLFCVFFVRQAAKGTSPNAEAGHCKYTPGLLAGADDWSRLEALASDLDREASGNGTGDFVQWSRHLKHENPTFSPAFTDIVQSMANYYDVDVFASRLNFYRDGTDWKPFHHDSHAFDRRTGVKEDFTMGASFGDSRALAFLHEPSGSQFAFPQNNGKLLFALPLPLTSATPHTPAHAHRGCLCIHLHCE